MGLAEFQSALARLYIDPALRDRFFAEPPAVGAELRLTSNEAGNLARIQRQVEQYANSLRRKRCDQVRRVIPIAARSLGDKRFAELFERYANESPPRGSKADLADAADFVVAIRRGAQDMKPPWAVDLAEYELNWRQAVHAGRAPLIRIFRYPVGRLAIGGQPEPIVPRTTVALWWRPSRRGRVQHVVLSMPGMRF